MGARSRDIQVKMLSERKANRDGNCADVVPDAPFQFTLDSRFSRRGEPQVTNFSRLLTYLTEWHVKVSQRGVIFSDARVCARPPYIAYVD